MAHKDLSVITEYQTRDIVEVIRALTDEIKACRKLLEMHLGVQECTCSSGDGCTSCKD